MASLLEVGTGFHPELTGRENIFLNGSILGMSKKEIESKFDQIVSFAEVEKFVDTPVKRYSSGMYVRLAFSVASHLNPDILIIDEVLAVGDAQFQKKCIERMQEISKENKTIIFVSHNMQTLKELCTKGILLNKGELVKSSSIDDCIGTYLNDIPHDYQSEWHGCEGDDSIKLLHTWVKATDSNVEMNTAQDLKVGIEIEVLKETKDLIMGFTLLSEYGYELAFVLYDDCESSSSPTIKPGKIIKEFTIPANSLAYGTYSIEYNVGIHYTKRIITSQGQLTFRLDNTSGIGQRFYMPPKQGWNSLFRPDWEVK